MPESRAATPETLEVKRRGRHRLIGAITLAVLAVVIIPMVLDSEPRKVGRDLPLTIPSKEGLPPLPAPAAEPAKPQGESPKPVAAADAPKATEPTAQDTAAKPAEAIQAEAKVEPVKAVAAKTADKASESPAKVAVKPATKAVDKTPDKAANKTEKAAPKMEGFVIQLGAFSEAEKLDALKAKMKSAKVAVFTEKVKTADGSLTRLRAGPYKSREQADKALVQIKKAGVDGQVVPLP